MSEQNNSCRTIRKLHFVSCFSRTIIVAKPARYHKW